MARSAGFTAAMAANELDRLREEIQLCRVKLVTEPTAMRKQIMKRHIARCEQLIPKYEAWASSRSRKKTDRVQRTASVRLKRKREAEVRAMRVEPAARRAKAALARARRQEIDELRATRGARLDARRRDRRR